MNNENKQVDLKSLSDFDLLALYDEARATMSYYNAAEGSWSSETKGRNIASNELKNVRAEVKLRDLTANPGQYLC